MPYSFRSEQWLPYPVETVFAFFADPENLPALLPPWQHARLESVTLVAPPRTNGKGLSNAAGAGSRIKLSLRSLPFLPIRTSWDAEIVQFEANHSFCDRQLRGPFTYWQHNHRFLSLDRNGPSVTVLTDEIEYDLPLGPLGSIARALFVRKQIEKTFSFRREQVVRALAQTVPSQAENTAHTSRAS
jgi:ligand-binding SRPBCC domain-containing protein